MKTNEKNVRMSLEERINDYFLYCDAVNDKHGEIIKPYTLSGLLCYTGITRDEFDKMSAANRYKKIIARAKSKIEAFIEENALTSELSCNASLNSLKYNFGWGEKPEKEQEAVSKTINVTLSPEMTELAR